MTPAIAIKNLTKYYKNFKALDDITFDVQPGEFFGFLGPNGAGKTTAISILTGLANYQEGTVQVFGHDVVREYRQSRAKIGLVPQEFNFDPFLSAEQILTFEGGYFGLGWKESKARAQELLDVFSLSDKRKEGYKKLSGGMKRRLLIARAMMHSPKILILDEPTAGVDLELRHQLWEFLRKINKQGITVFLTTHYIEEAEKLCSRIGVIHKGRIAAMETTDVLIRKMSGDQMVIMLKKPFEGKLPADLQEAEILVEDLGLRLRFEEKGGWVSRVLKMLYDSGYEVEKVDVRRPTLEDAFLKLTGRKTEKFEEFKL